MKNKLNNYAFIDSQNLYLSIKGQGWKLDYKRFRIYLKDKYKVSKIFIFIGYVPGNEKLYKFLQECGYIMIFKPTLELKGGKIKGNVDAELVLHTMIEYNSFDKAIIISGDGDFYCLIEHLIDNKKLIKVLIPNKNKYSSLLKKFYKYLVFLNHPNLKTKIGIKKEA